MEVEEESPHGTLIGYLTAYDPDIGENALIDYIISGELFKYNNHFLTEFNYMYNIFRWQ